MSLLTFAKTPTPTKEYNLQLTKETASRILYLMRLGHPNEHDEYCNRSEIMDEVRRRGKQLLIDLNWTTEESSIYKNRYTGCEETLKQLKKGICGRGINWDQLFSIIEHWTPKNLWTNEDLLDKNKGLNRWVK